MSDSIQIASNPTTAKIIGASEDAKLEVHRLLSYNVNGAEHMAAFQSGGWSGKSSFFNFKAGTFPAGFVHLVTAGLRKAGFAVQLIKKPLPAPLGTPMPDVDGMGYSDRYDYQPEAVRQLLRHGQITARVATGGGKSRIARIAMAWIKRPTLFLTTRSILMYQMHDSLEQMTGSPVAVLGDGEWGIDYTKPDGSPGRKMSLFNVGMVQTLAQRLKEPDITSFPSDQAKQQARREIALAVLAKFEFVILEEAHECSSDQFWSVMMACKNAAYRMALTATPFMKDDEEANMRLLGCSGPIAVNISEELLIGRGILARPYFKFIKLEDDTKRPKRLYRSTSYKVAYECGIVHNDYRNKLIAVEVARAVKYGLSGMVLVRYKEHGKVLQELFTKLGVRAEFIFGESSAKRRKEIIGKLARREIDVLIGSTILDVGVDVPAVGVIALAGGGMAEVGTRQRIGRGLREKKHGPNVALIIDVADDFNMHLKKHAQERRSIIESTPGFAENIVADFNYQELGFIRKAA